jgi:signal peptidase I
MPQSSPRNRSPPTAAVAAPDDLIKRVVAVAGDTIEARHGTVLLNGTALIEPYVSSPTSDFGPVVVPNGRLFVMGDNRANSSDSRVFGTIDQGSVIGSAFARTWPLSRVGTVH